MSCICVCLIGCYGAAYNRMKLREKYEGKRKYCMDCLIYGGEYRELKHRRWVDSLINTLLI